MRTWLRETPNDDGTTHVHFGWNYRGEENIRHGEAYDVDSGGNITRYHYSQNGEGDAKGTQVTFNYHNENWSDRSK